MSSTDNLPHRVIYYNATRIRTTRVFPDRAKAEAFAALQPSQMGEPFIQLASEAPPVWTGAKRLGEKAVVRRSLCTGCLVRPRAPDSDICCECSKGNSK